MVTIHKLSEYTFEQALHLWNEGFQGYAMDMTFSLDQLINRFGVDGLSADASVVAEVDGKPAGFVLNGIAEIGGKRVGWNGGTGVAPACRGQGIGSRLVEASLDVYREKGAQMALLEALADNHPAIALYKKLGYDLLGKLAIVQCADTFAEEALASPASASFAITAVHPAQVSALWFYPAQVPWQSHWTHIQGAEAVAAHDAAGTAIGYALFRRSFDQEGQLRSIVLYQCETLPGHADQDGLVKALLRSVFASAGTSISRVGFNLPTSNTVLLDTLLAAGFKTVAEQVHMCKALA